MGYIASVILRDRDMTDASGAVKFTEPGDGTLEERVYYCQNWRADVSALVDYTSGDCLQLEHDKYLSYGTPWGLPAGDLDSDGDYDVNDEKDIDALILATGYDVRADADLDGAVTAYDKADLSGSKITLGRGLMSDSGTFNRRGYAGYDNDGVLGDGANPNKSNTRFWHVRHRVLDSTIGRWTRRDPARYVDSANLAQLYDRRSWNGGCVMNLSTAQMEQSWQYAQPEYPGDHVIPGPTTGPACTAWIDGELSRRGIGPSSPCGRRASTAGARCCYSGGASSDCVNRALHEYLDCLGTGRPTPGVTFTACVTAGDIDCARQKSECRWACLAGCIAGCVLGSPGGLPGCVAVCFIVASSCFTGCELWELTCNAAVRLYCAGYTLLP